MLEELREYSPTFKKQYAGKNVLVQEFVLLILL